MTKLVNQPTGAINPENERLMSLFHDLNSTWGVISWATHMLNEEFLSPTDYQLYDDMFERNSLKLQPVLAQLGSYSPYRDVVTTLVEWLTELQVQKSLAILGSVTPFIVRLNELYGKGVDNPLSER